MTPKELNNTINSTLDILKKLLQFSSEMYYSKERPNGMTNSHADDLWKLKFDLERMILDLPWLKNWHDEDVN